MDPERPQPVSFHDPARGDRRDDRRRAGRPGLRRPPRASTWPSSAARTCGWRTSRSPAPATRRSCGGPARGTAATPPLGRLLFARDADGNVAAVGLARRRPTPRRRRASTELAAPAPRVHRASSAPSLGRAVRVGRPPARAARALEAAHVRPRRSTAAGGGPPTATSRPRAHEAARGERARGARRDRRARSRSPRRRRRRRRGRARPRCAARPVAAGGDAVRRRGRHVRAPRARGGRLRRARPRRPSSRRGSTRSQARRRGRDRRPASRGRRACAPRSRRRSARCSAACGCATSRARDRLDELDFELPLAGGDAPDRARRRSAAIAPCCAPPARRRPARELRRAARRPGAAPAASAAT